MRINIKFAKRSKKYPIETLLDCFCNLQLGKEGNAHTFWISSGGSAKVTITFLVVVDFYIVTAY